MRSGIFKKIHLPFLVDINIILDDFKIDPLESAFGMRSGLNKVKVFGVYQQRKCALFRTHRVSVPIMDPDQTLTLTVSVKG